MAKSKFCRYCNRPIKMAGALAMHERHCKMKPEPKEGSIVVQPDAKEVIEGYFEKLEAPADKPAPPALSSSFTTLRFLRGELRQCETRAANLRKLIDTVEKIDLMPETY